MGEYFFPAVVFFDGLSISNQATRWDNYLHIFDPRIHWFSLINSLVIVVFLCAMVSMIVYRSVSRDVRPCISRVSICLIIDCSTDFSVQCN